MTSKSIYTFTLLGIAAVAITANSYAYTDQRNYIGGLDGWKVNIAPFLALVKMNGTSQIGTLRAHADNSAANPFATADIAGLIHFEARKYDINLFLDGFYATLTDKARDGTASPKAKNRLGMISGGVGYRLAQYGKAVFTPYAGFRHTSNSSELSTPSNTSSDQEFWTSPLAGLHILYQFTDAISGIFTADVSGTNTSSQYDWSLSGLFGYRPQDKYKFMTFYLGYMYFQQSYQSGSGTNKYLWEMQLTGPMIGINFDLA